MDLRRERGVVIPDNPMDPRRTHLLALLEEIREGLDALPLPSGQEHNMCHGAYHSLKAVINTASIVKAGPAVILVGGLSKSVEVERGNY